MLIVIIKFLSWCSYRIRSRDLKIYMIMSALYFIGAGNQFILSFPHHWPFIPLFVVLTFILCWFETSCQICLNIVLIMLSLLDQLTHFMKSYILFLILWNQVYLILISNCSFVSEKHPLPRLTSRWRKHLKWAMPVFYALCKSSSLVRLCIYNVISDLKMIDFSKKKML